MIVMESTFKIMILLLFMSSITVITGRSVSMCTNDTYTATNYQLSRTESDPTNCTCLLTSTEQTTTKIVFNILSISGCRYKLGFYWNEKRPFMSCNSSASLFYTITSETIKLNLEPYQEGWSETLFSLNITSTPETNLTLSCFVPRIETSSTTTITSTHQPTTTISSTHEPTTTISSSHQPTTTISSAHEPTTTSTTEFQTKSMVSSTFTKTTQLSNIITTIPTSQQQTNSITTSSDEETVAGDTTLALTTSPSFNMDQQEKQSSGDDSTVGIAVGCFIGGIVFGIIVVLGLLWFRLKRQKKDEIYSTPTNREDHTYDSIIPGSGVENIDTTEETTQTSSSTIGEATVAPNSTGENSTSNPSVTYQNVSNKPYLNV